MGKSVHVQRGNIVRVCVCECGCACVCMCVYRQVFRLINGSSSGTFIIFQKTIISWIHRKQNFLQKVWQRERQRQRNGEQGKEGKEKVRKERIKKEKKEQREIEAESDFEKKRRQREKCSWKGERKKESRCIFGSFHSTCWKMRKFFAFFTRWINFSLILNQLINLCVHFSNLSPAATMPSKEKRWELLLLLLWFAQMKFLVLKPLQHWFVALHWPAAIEARRLWIIL